MSRVLSLKYRSSQFLHQSDYTFHFIFNDMYLSDFWLTSTIVILQFLFSVSKKQKKMYAMADKNVRDKQDATYYRQFDHCQRSNMLLKQDITLLFNGIGKVLYNYKGTPVDSFHTRDKSWICQVFNDSHTAAAFHFYWFYVRSNKTGINAPLKM